MTACPIDIIGPKCLGVGGHQPSAYPDLAVLLGQSPEILEGGKFIAGTSVNNVSALAIASIDARAGSHLCQCDIGSVERP